MDMIKAALDLRRDETRRSRKQGSWPPCLLALALQGGGSFGAFTWGALDRLLEEESIGFDAFSGASAGAVNAVLLASGLAHGGRAGARKNLEDFWSHVSQKTLFLPKAVSVQLGFLARALSPYQFNPFDLNPLRQALESHVDFEVLRAAVRAASADRRDACFRRQPPYFPQRGVDGGNRARLGLPAVAAPYDRDRRRGLLGRRLCRQSAADAARRRIRRLRRADHPDHADARASRAAQPSRHRASHRPDQFRFDARTRDRGDPPARAALRGGRRNPANGRNCALDRITAENEVEQLAEASPGNLEWSFISSLRDAGRAAADAWIEQVDDPTAKLFDG